MTKLLCAVGLLFLLSCKTTSYYITRHGEKAGTTVTDPPLSAEGEKQALDLRNYLTGKGIKTIYSTNFIRTKATAEPTSQLFVVPVKIYDPAKLNELIAELKAINNGNVLIVGHSNTVDDVANGLTGRNVMSDLADNEYGNLFIVKKKGANYSFERMKVPQTAPR
ncbi:MAG: histidine phosphatase family protein [Bacteroidota bacterium]|nr:histidine phosphatase family protein [Bacteroidota bacterium]